MIDFHNIETKARRSTQNRAPYRVGYAQGTVWYVTKQHGSWRADARLIDVARINGPVTLRGDTLADISKALEGVQLVGEA